MSERIIVSKTGYGKTAKFYEDLIKEIIEEKDREIERLNKIIVYLLEFIKDMFDEESISNSFNMTTKEFIEYINSKLKEVIKGE